MEYFGNKAILKNHKVGFLSSRRCPAEVVLKSYDWAREQRAAGVTVICGNHSQIEKDVFEILLKGEQPLILMLARGMKIKWEQEILKALNENRLLVISCFSHEESRVTKENAEKRNQQIFELADELVIGYSRRNGMLEKLSNRNKKKIQYLYKNG